MVFGNKNVVFHPEIDAIKCGKCGVRNGKYQENIGCAHLVMFSGGKVMPAMKTTLAT